MTDITELMQRLKETASKATQGEWQVYGKPVSTNFDAMYIFSRLIQGTVGEQGALYMLSADGLCPALTGTGPNSKNNAEFIAQANPANILALVESLEKAQQQNKSDFEIKARLCKESNSLHDRLRVAEKRIAELESRTVKLPEVQQPIDGTGYANAAGARYYKECVIKALTAQGIKLEAE